MHKTTKIFSLVIASVICSSTSLAAQGIYKGQLMPMSAQYAPMWYAGANIGVSTVHDKKAAGSNDSVTLIGPGWSADLGYQFLKLYNTTFAGELGYTQYHKSTENTPGVNVANTEHFASYAALVGHYALPCHFGILGKLGVAYSYAKKVFVASGVSRSANVYSAYYGLGATYDMTQQASLVLQWARAHGNGKTGSTDLSSLGVSYAFA